MALVGQTLSHRSQFVHSCPNLILYGLTLAMNVGAMLLVLLSLVALINGVLALIPVGETTEDRHFSLEQVACIGACGLAPCITVNSAVEGTLTPKKIAKVLAKNN